MKSNTTLLLAAVLFGFCGAALAAQDTSPPFSLVDEIGKDLADLAYGNDALTGYVLNVEPAEAVSYDVAGIETESTHVYLAFAYVPADSKPDRNPAILASYGFIGYDYGTGYAEKPPGIDLRQIRYDHARRLTSIYGTRDGYARSFPNGYPNEWTYLEGRTCRASENFA